MSNEDESGLDETDAKKSQKLRKIKKEKKTEAEGGEKTGIGRYAMEAIKAGMNNDEAVAYILQRMPEAKTKPSTVNWYRTYMRRNGIDFPPAPRKERVKKVKEEAVEEI